MSNVWRKNVANNGHKSWWLEAGQNAKVSIGKWGKAFIICEYQYKGAVGYAPIDNGTFFKLADAQAAAERIYIGGVR